MRVSRAWANAFLGAILLGPPAWSQAKAGGWSAASKVCTITDARLPEMSGLAVSRRNPGLFYVHNDSGDTARFFALNKAGRVVATINVTGVKAVDWEDIAAGYDPRGRPTVYLGDIGDNLAARPEVAVYAVPEPKLDPSAPEKTLEVSARTLRFRYPDGPHDAETLMAEPHGRALYVVTKERTAVPSTVYRLDPKWDAEIVQTAAKVGTITFSDMLPIYPNMATGGDISPDGRRMVVRTYQQAYEWTIPAGKGPEEALKGAPVVTPLNLEAQGEAIGYGLNSRTWLTTTERLPAPVWQYTWKPVPKEAQR